MKKIIIALLVVAVIVAGWFLFTTSDTIDYVAAVDTEITELENELAALDAEVTAGTLSEADATAAKVRIVTRLNSINTAATESERAQLTPAQRVQLVEGLERLKNILITYQATLTVVENTAVETEVQAELTRNGGSYNRSKHLSLVVADTIDDVEETVQDSVQDYEPDLMLDEVISEVVEDTEAEVIAEAEADAEAEMEVTDAEATSTEEETGTEAEMSTMENPETDETAVEVDADATIETELTN